MKKGWGAVALFLGIVITVGIGVRSFLDLPGKLAARTVQGVREGITEIFVDLLHVRPEVREGTKVTWGQTAVRTEIVVAEKKIRVEYDWEHQWMGSRKDRAAAMAKLTEEARLQAKRSGILRQAEEITGSRLTELANRRSIRLRLQAPAE
ncbi:MAG: hypothetical protein EBZ83_06130 [Verrucomicrobia bacterium]|nr:hypothetical protein [Verrucomicrobiota bacterium]